MTTPSRKRFGAKRVPDCECTYSFTCRPCLKDAGPTIEWQADPEYVRDSIRYSEEDV